MKIKKKDGTKKKKKKKPRKSLRELGFLIDVPKQQTGNTNDGNFPRKFLRNAAKSAKITGGNFELIKR